LAFLAFVALDEFLKQKLAFADKNYPQLTFFQQSDIKINFQTRSSLLNHCVIVVGTLNYVLPNADKLFKVEFLLIFQIEC
jgi:hypothetical protein